MDTVLNRDPDSTETDDPDSMYRVLAEHLSTNNFQELLNKYEEIFRSDDRLKQHIECQMRTHAKEMFQNKRYNDAIETYAGLLQVLRPSEEEQRSIDRRSVERRSIERNLAICYFQTKQYDRAFGMLTEIRRNERPKSDPKTTYWILKTLLAQQHIIPAKLIAIELITANRNNPDVRSLYVYWYDSYCSIASITGDSISDIPTPPTDMITKPILAKPILAKPILAKPIIGKPIDMTKSVEEKRFTRMFRPIDRWIGESPIAQSMLNLLRRHTDFYIGQQTNCFLQNVVWDLFRIPVSAGPQAVPVWAHSSLNGILPLLLLRCVPFIVGTNHPTERHMTYGLMAKHRRIMAADPATDPSTEQQSSDQSSDPTDLVKFVSKSPEKDDFVIAISPSPSLYDQPWFRCVKSSNQIFPRCIRLRIGYCWASDATHSIVGGWVSETDEFRLRSLYCLPTIVWDERSYVWASGAASDAGCTVDLSGPKPKKVIAVVVCYTMSDSLSDSDDLVFYDSRTSGKALVRSIDDDQVFESWFVTENGTIVVRSAQSAQSAQTVQSSDPPQLSQLVQVSEDAQVSEYTQVACDTEFAQPTTSTDRRVRLYIGIPGLCTTKDSKQLDQNSWCYEPIVEIYERNRTLTDRFITQSFDSIKPDHFGGVLSEVRFGDTIGLRGEYGLERQLDAINQCRRYLDHLSQIGAIGPNTTIERIRLQIAVVPMVPLGPVSLHGCTTLLRASYVPKQWFSRCTGTSSADAGLAEFKEVELDWNDGSPIPIPPIRATDSNITEQPMMLVLKSKLTQQMLATPLGDRPTLKITSSGIDVDYERPPLHDPTMVERQQDWFKDWQKIDQRLKNYPEERRIAAMFIGRAKTNRSEFQIGTPSLELFGW